jgi:hypothetical protein
MPTPNYLPPGPPAFSIRGIAYWAMIDPFSGAIDQNGRPSREVAYLVDGATVGPACDALKGIGTFTSSPYNWPTPHRYPGNTNLVCLSVRFETRGPRRSGPQLITSPLAVVYANYGVPDLDIYGDRPEQAFDPANPIPWASYEVRNGKESIPLKADGLKYKSATYAGIAPTSTLQVRIPTKDYILRRSMIPDFNAYAGILEALEGTVNLNPWWGRAKGRFLFDGFDKSYDFDASGKQVGDFSMYFVYRGIDHNAEPVDGMPGTYDVITDEATGLLLNYPYGDFSPITEYGLA